MHITIYTETYKIMNELFTIPARKGKAAHVKKGQKIKVINTHGNQVVDTWAYNSSDLSEFQSNEHTRPCIMSMKFKPGDSLYTNLRRPILDVVEDTTPGIHDLLMAACDMPRYKLLGCTEYHDNCSDNLINCMAELGFKISDVPSPVNLFMNIPWTGSGELSWEAPVSKPGDYILLRATMDCVIAFSACPQDILPINGVSRKPTEAHFQIY